MSTESTTPNTTHHRVIIESPYQGHVERNTVYARRAMQHSLSLNEAPLASHLLYTQVLIDTIPEQRKQGIEAGYAWWLVADLVVFYIDYGMSPGMVKAEERATQLLKPVAYRRIGPN